MAITAAAVKDLRDRTGAGMMDCKKALTEADGDLTAAIEILRTKGLAAASKKAHRKASEGAVTVVGDAAAKVVLELNCETDFVARNPKFQDFARALAEQALAAKISTVDELRQQPFAGDPGSTVEQAIAHQIATIGENIVLSRLARTAARPGYKLSSYIHGGGKIGVVVEGSESVSDEALHDVALHVAAAQPRFVKRAEVTEDILATERRIARQQAIDQGKPEHIADKMVTGKMEKFFEQEVLLEQPFAKDTDKTVAQYLRESGGEGATVASFVCFRLGESVDS
ncbi:MAG TPA: translation elongation factor Ts [Acidimicrobiales bacterium]